MSGSSSSSKADAHLLKHSSESSYGSKWPTTVPAPVDQSTTTQQVDIKLSRQRVWAVFVSAIIASLPALLVGCTLGFPSGALLDLTDLEPRPEYKFNSVLSDIFGASLSCIMCTL